MERIDEMITESGFYTGRADFVTYCARKYYDSLLELYILGYKNNTQAAEYHRQIIETIAVDEFMFRNFREGSYRPINVKIAEGQYVAIIGLGIKTGAYDNIQTFLRAAVSSGIKSGRTDPEITERLKKATNDFKS